MEYPIQFVPDIPVKLRADQALLRGQHIVVIGITGTGCVKEAY
jgi:MoxR-like ATPase